MVTSLQPASFDLHSSKILKQDISFFIKPFEPHQEKTLILHMGRTKV